VNRFVASKVSVSAVIINPHGGQDVSIMQSLCGATGGRYYRVDDPQQLPSIFVKEAKTLKRSMIQNKTFTPRLEFPSPILKGIEGLPPLHGYVLTSPKERSTVVLRSPETEEVEPVLALWRFGLGKTAAFTSDLSPNWAADWIAWPRYEAFVQQLMIDVSRVERATHLQMQTFAAGDEGVVTVEDDHSEEAMLEVEAQINGPHQRARSLVLTQVGPRRYQGRFPLWGKGRYQVTLAGAGGGRSETAMGGFALAYSPEYLRFSLRPDPPPALGTEDRRPRADGPRDRKGTLRGPARAERKFAAGLRVAARVARVPDPRGRRRAPRATGLGPDPRLVRPWLRGGVHRDTRRAAQTQGDGRRTPGRRAGCRPPGGRAGRGAAARRAPRAPAPAPSARPPAAAPDEGAPQTTTERLLALKKKRGKNP